jgi:3-hydroxybutyryl-CoA dehydrogenase
MEINKITVIGAGTMGHGIAGQAALSGFHVVLNDVDDSRTHAGLAAIRKVWAQGVAKGKVAPEAVAAAEARLFATADLEQAVGDADLVIEAVPEIMELKRAIFGRAHRAAPAGALLASNTSSLSLTEIAGATGRPAQVIGMHFFNPVAVMPLLELVRGEQTSETTVESARAVGARLGKETIVVQDSPGFATSRLGIALGNEAMRMFEEGVASAEDIDKAMTLGPPASATPENTSGARQPATMAWPAPEDRPAIHTRSGSMASSGSASRASVKARSGPECRPPRLWAPP